MSETRIGIVGAGGRMGRMLIEATLKGEGVALGAAFDVPGSPAMGGHGQTAPHQSAFPKGEGFSPFIIPSLPRSCKAWSK